MNKLITALVVTIFLANSNAQAACAGTWTTTSSEHVHQEVNVNVWSGGEGWFLGSSYRDGNLIVNATAGYSGGVGLYIPYFSQFARGTYVACPNRILEKWTETPKYRYITDPDKGAICRVLQEMVRVSSGSGSGSYYGMVIVSDAQYIVQECK